jgi:hypothetical protein
MRRLKAGCVTLRISAAREKLDVSASATKSSSHFISTPGTFPCVCGQTPSRIALYFSCIMQIMHNTLPKPYWPCRFSTSTLEKTTLNVILHAGRAEQKCRGG